MARQKHKKADTTLTLIKLLQANSLAQINDRIDIYPITSLWAGYGTAYKAKVSNAKSTTQYVIKQIKARPGLSSISDKRKMASYENERLFYKKVAPDLIAQSIVNIPTPYYLSQNADELVFVLGDISDRFPTHREDLGETELVVALSWLAKFHAYFWQDRDKCKSLSAKGSYWHLDTRPDEFARIPAKWSRLKDSAATIDLELKKSACTIIHGDFKPANIQFSHDGSNCVVYDYQYCGWGCPLKDVSYLLFCFSDGATSYRERDVLFHYYQELSKQLEAVSKEPLSNVDLNRLYDFAYLDFFRFLMGWYYHSHQPPQHMVHRAQALLDRHRL